MYARMGEGEDGFDLFLVLFVKKIYVIMYVHMWKIYPGIAHITVRGYFNTCRVHSVGVTDII